MTVSYLFIMLHSNYVSKTFLILVLKMRYESGTLDLNGLLNIVIMKNVIKVVVIVITQMS